MVRMWGRALMSIQRVDRAGWDRLDLVSRWLIVSRASVLVITFISVAIAGLLAIRAGRFDPVLWVLTALALVLAHATNNLLNDLTDHLKGVDKNNYFRAIYGPHALEHKLLSMRGLLAYAAFSGIIAIAIGTYFVVTGVWDWDVALVGLPYALGATTVIFGKHIDKLDDDKTRGIHTLPVLIGERAARWILGA